VYFWRIDALKTQLLQGPLSDRQVLPYLVLYCALTAAVGLIPIGAMNAWDFLDGSWSVLLAVIGTIYIYRQNGGGTGQHLLQRYLAIGWVVGVRWVAAMLAVFVVYFGSVEVFGELSEATTWQESLMLAAAETVLYWRIGHHVFQVAHPEAWPNKSLERTSEG
jgi:hypothetical protein